MARDQQTSLIHYTSSVCRLVSVPLGIAKGTRIAWVFFVFFFPCSFPTGSGYILNVFCLFALDL